MINIQKAIEEYNKYVKNYNIKDKKIGLKVAHMLRVKELSKKIAESLNLEQEDIELAELIGLLHDIGRFEQLRVYNTYIDKNSINHGELGVKILFDNGLISNFVEDRSYDQIIKKAILNHNKNEIEKDLNPRELLHAKIIRDADKMDIFNIISFECNEAVYESEHLEEENFTNEVYEDFISNKSINYKNISTHADTVICHLAYIYDINFRNSLTYIKENHYIDTLYNRLNFNNIKTQKQLDFMYNITKNYLEKNCI